VGVTTPDGSDDRWVNAEVTKDKHFYNECPRFTTTIPVLLSLGGPHFLTMGQPVTGRLQRGAAR